MESDDSDFEAPTNNLCLPCQNQSHEVSRGPEFDSAVKMTEALPFFGISGTGNSSGAATKF